MLRLKDQLGEWAANELRYWEQAALDKISRRVPLTHDCIQEIVDYFLQDAGLRQTPEERPRLALLENAIAVAEPAACRLLRIFNLAGVNALAEKQEIRFGPQLTVLYGTNGAGKSGYARALGAAGFARGKREVLPNATGAQPRNRPQADIEIAYPSTTAVITWTEGKRCPELGGFYLFDGGSLAAHLNDPNSLSFTPGGLAILTELSELTDVVRDGVRLLIEKREAANNFEAFFDGDSEAKNQVRQLGAHSDIDSLKKLAELSSEQLATIPMLETEVAQLKVTNPAKHIEMRRREIRDLEALVASIDHAQYTVGDQAVAAVNEATSELRDRRQALVESGVEQFKSELFSQVGTAAWHEFVTAAKLLADREAGQGSPYPASGDHCLLCRQTLSGEAIDHIRRLWTFLVSDAQSAFSQAQSRCTNYALRLERLDLNYLAAGSNARRILEENLATIIPSLEAQIEACEERRTEMLRALAKEEPCVPPPLIAIDIIDVRRLVSVLRDDVSQLQASDINQRLLQSEQSLRELRHRRILGERIPEIQRYIGDRKWARRARECLGSTRVITAKYNELFNSLVTERYRSLFEETLRRFKSDIKVTIETRGFKGETVRQLVLNPKVFRPGFSIDQILSEGEKRAVAVADFLTEAALDQRNNGIILDDPVTSLDDKWKNTLAACLAEVAKTRQVVVLTHDLAFLYRIKERADELQVDLASHWIREENGRPGFVHLYNSPICEKDYKSAKFASDYYAKAKDAEPAEQQALLQQGFAALRTSYEALIIFEVFNEVVARFEERVSFGRLEGVRIDPKLVEEIIRRMETLSRYIEGHLHSDRFASTKPSTATLLEEIKAFDAIRNTQKELKKQAAQPATANKATDVADTHQPAEPEAMEPREIRGKFPVTPSH